MTEQNSDQLKPENLRTVYSELCTSYRAIDDFRTKLLVFLPLATSGLFLLIANPEKANVIEPLLLPIGIFGFAIAFGLFCFELYGIRECTCLIRAGAQLEEQLGDIKGQFATRPLGVLGFINEPFAAGIIYPAVLEVWAYLVFYDAASDKDCFAAIWVFTIGFLLSLLFIVWLKYLDKPSE